MDETLKRMIAKNPNLSTLIESLDCEVTDIIAKPQPRKFSYFKAPVTNKNPYKNITLQDLSKAIRGNYYKERCEVLRSIQDKDRKRQYKAQNFDFVTISGIFKERKSESLDTHSNLICIDLDDVDVQHVRNLLINDPETIMLFISPSGNGIKWVVEIDISLHDQRTWFNGIARYLKDKYNITADPSGKDVARACFVSHDPECHLNSKFL